MKRFGILAACLLVGLMTQTLSAQDGGGKQLVNELVKHWQSSKDLSLAVANAMPDENYSFKATEAEMSFGEQMNHIALAAGSYCSRAMATKSPLSKPADATKPTAVKNLTTAYDFCIDGLKERNDADLQKMIKTKDGEVSAFELFWGGFTHSAHHRGQAEVYLRLKGVTPPAYKF
jgi:uncharacterized damage-inducible protein DinB